MQFERTCAHSHRWSVPPCTLCAKSQNWLRIFVSYEHEFCINYIADTRYLHMKTRGKMRKSFRMAVEAPFIYVWNICLPNINWICELMHMGFQSNRWEVMKIWETYRRKQKQEVCILCNNLNFLNYFRLGHFFPQINSVMKCCFYCYGHSPAFLLLLLPSH